MGDERFDLEPRRRWRREHGHAHGWLAEVQHLLKAPAGRVLVYLVGAIAVGTVVGLALLWPSGDLPTGAKFQPTVKAVVSGVQSEACRTPTPQTCRTLKVIVDGRGSDLELGPVTAAPLVKAGDTVRVTEPPWPANEPKPPNFQQYSFVDVQRSGSLFWLCLAAALLAIVLLRLRGLLAVLGVGLSLGVVFVFVIPAILTGEPAIPVALCGGLAVMFVTVLLTNGIGAQSMAAALGISATLGLSAAMAALATNFARLDGKSDEVTLALGTVNGDLSLTGVVLAGMLIGALGVMADTAVTQASAVMALRRADSSFGARALYAQAFIVGRDHLSATIHTLVLAYTGAALPLLLVMRQSQLPVSDALNSQSIAEPIVATAVGCIALIVAVPLTTALAAVLVARVPADALPEHIHAH